MHPDFATQGYLAVPGFKNQSALDAVRTRAAELVEAFDPESSRTVFTTREQHRQVDDYFLGSAHTVRCFFEEEAFDDQGRLKQDKALSINKIGHALHDLEPVFDHFSHGPELAEMARLVGLAQPQLRQSMVIFKQPVIGGEVRWHQDATFFDTSPVSVTTFWFALEDAHVGNGCLWVQPGGHRSALRERFVRAGNRAAIEPLDATPWPDDRSARPLEVAAGTLLVFHGLLPHYSAPNRSNASRHAYTLHVTDANTSYASTNWLQPALSRPLRGFI